MNKTTNYLIIKALVLLCACQTSPPNTPHESNFNLSKNNNKVKVDVVKKTHIDISIEAKGKIDALEMQQLYFKQGGILQSICVKNGQYIQKGDTIAVLDTTYLHFDVIKAEHQLSQAQEKYTELKINYKGGAHLLSAKELDKKLRIRSGFSQAKLHLNYQKKLLKEHVIIAQNEGLVTNLNIKEKEHLTPQQVFGCIYNPQTLIADLNILEKDHALLKKGQQLNIELLAQSHHSFQATLYEKNPSVNENGLVRVKLKIKNNPRNKLLLGTFIKSKVNIKSPKAIYIPKAAIIERNGHSAAFCINQQLAVWHPLELGREYAEYIEVKKGLKEKDSLIISHAHFLEHDTRVEAY